jgi:hypothetical protein
MKYLFLAFILLFGCVSQEVAPPADSTPQPTAPDEPPGVPEEPPDTQESVPEPPPAEPAATIKSEEVSYTSFGWEIHGTLYPAVNEDNPTKGIILVPMLDHTRDSYPQSFIEDLHDSVPDAIILAIDARGHGESTNLGTWQSFGLEEWKGMAVDIRQAKKYFKENHPTADEYYVVGASIGSTAALVAGKQENDITKVAMLSPGIEYKGVNIEDEAEDYIHYLLLAYTSGDSYSSSSGSQIQSVSSSRTTVKEYSGSSHGTDMFDDTQLSSDLVTFLKG